MRAIQRRANGPFFSGGILLLETRGATHVGNVIHYFYPTEPLGENSRLSETTANEPVLPPDYPDGRLAGLRVPNKGGGLRYVVLESKDGISLADTPYAPGNFAIRYRFRAAERGKELRFTLRFETDAGHKGKQVWATRMGERYIKRIYPK